MGDVGDDFRALKEHRKEQRAKLGVPCPECVRLLPKANPTILLPGQRCSRRRHDYVDQRKKCSWCERAVARECMTLQESAECKEPAA